MDEVDSIRDWLAASGYRLEAEAAQAFRRAGLTVIQGLHYEPDEAGARGGREIDVLAVSERLVPQPPMTRCTVLFAVECKASRVPWVVFRGYDEPHPLGAIGRHPMSGISRPNLLRSVDLGQDLWLLGLPANVGYRLVARGANAGASGDKAPADPAYSAIQQVVSAAQGVLRGDPSGLPTIVVPVIVVGSHLFSITYDEAGGEEIVASKWERILWRGSRTTEPIAIDVVGRDHLENYAQQAAKGAEEFLPILRAATLNAREEEFRRQGEDLGRADRVALGVEAVLDGASRLTARLPRRRRKPAGDSPPE